MEGIYAERRRRLERYLKQTFFSDAAVAGHAGIRRRHWSDAIAWSRGWSYR
jgi:hypothetical protein